MTNRLAAAVAAGKLAVGLLIGAAGAVLVGTATSPNTGGYITQMTDMHEAMSGMMGGQMGSGMMGGQMGSGMMGGQMGSGMMGPQR
jgi:hypothetical protein